MSQSCQSQTAGSHSRHTGTSSSTVNTAGSVASGVFLVCRDFARPTNIVQGTGIHGAATSSLYTQRQLACVRLDAENLYIFRTVPEARQCEVAFASNANDHAVHPICGKTAIDRAMSRDHSGGPSLEGSSSADLRLYLVMDHAQSESGPRSSNARCTKVLVNTARSRYSVMRLLANPTGNPWTLLPRGRRDHLQVLG